MNGLSGRLELPVRRMRAQERVEHRPGDFNDRSVRVFRRLLMAWYRVHARRLPWRGVIDPYETWVSEIMLQQTRVAAVIEHYTVFLEVPTVVALALAPEADVLAVWSGLGYYRRARMLHKAAQFVHQRARRRPPAAPRTELRTLPGVGEYTCAAIASIAFGESIAVVDGNVERVMLRVIGRPEDTSAAGRAFVRADRSSAGARDAALARRPEGVRDPINAAGDHNQAMMELGATICLPRAPLCLQLPRLRSLPDPRRAHHRAPRKQRAVPPPIFSRCARTAPAPRSCSNSAPPRPA